VTVIYQLAAIPAGRDYLSLSFSSSFLDAKSVSMRGPTLPDGPMTLDAFTGTAGDDVVAGTTGDDTFDMAQGGNDKVTGKAGNDTFNFGAVLNPGDKINGGADTFLEVGGSSVGDALDISGDYSAGLNLKAGTIVDIETIRLAAGHSYDIKFHDGNLAASAYMNANYLGTSAAFFVHLDGSNELDGDFQFSGGPGDDILIGGGGNDLLRPRGGTNLCDGGDGFDRVTFFGAGSAVTVDLNIQGIAQNTGFNTVTLDNIEDLAGTGHDDTLIGDSFGNWIIGNGGDDSVFGGQGNDIIEVGGKDAGGQLATNVQVDGGAGSGDMIGFLQTIALGNPTSVTITLATNAAQVTGQGTISITRVENAQGTTFNDTLTGNGGDNTLFGSEGSDTLAGANGDDTLWGDKTYMPFDGSPTDGPRVLLDPDVPGNDVMDGGGGEDRLIGDLLSDTMTGGADGDTFVYEEAADSTGLAWDVITDLNGAEDLFELWFQVTGLDAAVGVGKLRDTNFETDLQKAIKPNKMGADHAVVFTPDAGNLAGKIFLIVDANGTAGYQTGDMAIEITGATNLGGLDVADFTT
jgi:Ca2+-binding RTX toxin-like protein